MDTHPLEEHLEATYETELSRVGSSKALYAITEGKMEAETVLDAIGDRLFAAAATFDTWANTSQGSLETAFRQVAVATHDHSARISSHHEDREPANRPTPLETHLRTLETDAARLGGLIAWAAVTDRTLSQTVGFFVGNADPQAANRFRDIRSTLTDQIADAIAEVEAPDGEHETMKTVAGETVAVAYDHYVETLEGLGIKVKPVC